MSEQIFNSVDLAEHSLPSGALLTIPLSFELNIEERDVLYVIEVEVRVITQNGALKFPTQIDQIKISFQITLHTWDMQVSEYSLEHFFHEHWKQLDIVLLIH